MQLYIFTNGDGSENELGGVGGGAGFGAREHKSDQRHSSSLIRDPDSAPLRLIMSDPGLVGTCPAFIGIVALYLPRG